MTREEAIKILSSYDVNGVWADVDGKPYNAEEQAEAFDMAIEALQTPPISQRSMYQAGYRQGREEALKREPQKSYPTEWCEQCDLWEDNKCVGVAQCKHNIEALKHVTSDDLISRAEAAEIFEAMLKTATDQKIKIGISRSWQQIKDLPSADRPKGGDLISRKEALEALGEEPPVWCDEEYEIAERSQWRADVEAIKSVPSADRPKGEWVSRSGCYGVAYCSECDYELRVNNTNFCPNCGADMRTMKGANE